MNGVDVFVIGGGPAGLAAALAARRKGFGVMVAEATRPPIDKACGEGLMPDSVAALGELGVSLDPFLSYRFRGIRFLETGTMVEADFPIGRGFGVRRTVLHEAMIAAAESAGVILRWGARVTGITENSVTLDSERVTARWIVGADGSQSRVRHWAGLDATRSGSQRFGYRRHYPIAPWSEYMELHWGTGAQIYITPVSANEICVALLTNDRHLRLDQALERFPAVKGRLDGVPSSSSLRGAVSVSRRLVSVARANVALIGDASGSVDAVTGEGLCLSFRQALALADALEKGQLARYKAAHARINRRPAFMAAFLLAFDRYTRLRKRALSTFARKPDLFAGMLAMHVGELPVTRFAATGVHFAWQMLME